MSDAEMMLNDLPPSFCRALRLTAWTPDKEWREHPHTCGPDTGGQEVRVCGHKDSTLRFCKTLQCVWSGFTFLSLNSSQTSRYLLCFTHLQVSHTPHVWCL